MSCDQLTVEHQKLGPLSSPICGLTRMTAKYSSQGLPNMCSHKGKPSKTQNSHKNSSEVVIFPKNKPDLCLQIFPSYLLKYKKSFVRNISLLENKITKLRVASGVTGKWKNALQDNGFLCIYILLMKQI